MGYAKTTHSEGSFMKSVKRSSAASLALIASAILAPAANADCSNGNATLKGNYGFTFSGFSYGALGNGTVGIVGLGKFDGKGNFTATFDYSVGGAPQSNQGMSIGVPPAHPFGTTYTATYTVFADCSGVLNGGIFEGDNFTFIIVAGGMEIFAVDISVQDPNNPNAGGGNTITLDIKKVSSSD